MAGLNDDVDEGPVDTTHPLDQSTLLPSYVDQPTDNPELKDDNNVIFITDMNPKATDVQGGNQVNPEELFETIVNNELPSLRASVVFVNNKKEALENFQNMINIINSQGMSRDLALAIEGIHSGFITQERPLNFYTQSPTSTLKAISINELNKLIETNCYLTNTEITNFIKKLYSIILEFTVKVESVVYGSLVEKSNFISAVFEEKANLNKTGSKKLIFNNKQSFNMLQSADVRTTDIGKYTNDPEITKHYTSLQNLLNSSAEIRAFVISWDSLFTKTQTNAYITIGDVDISLERLAISLSETITKYLDMLLSYLRTTSATVFGMVNKIDTNIKTKDQTTQKQFVQSKIDYLTENVGVVNDCISILEHNSQFIMQLSDVMTHCVKLYEAFNFE